MNKINLDGIKRMHFIGIGGSGMFPLAQIMQAKGFIISGSDISDSETLEKVEKLGIKIYHSHQPSNVQNTDCVVYSAAIKEDNPEIQTAKAKNIPIIKRSELMGWIFNCYKCSIGVSGTHGKTTTTSMITSILIDAQKDPTAIIGGTLPKINSNSHVGKSEIIVGEACEYTDSFLCLHPAIAVITNVDEDHLDYFKNFENLKKSFSKYASQTTKLIVANGDDSPSLECIENSQAQKVLFGFKPSNDFYAKDLTFNKQQFASFSIFHKETKLTDISLHVPGKHNVYNALAAFAVCYEIGINSNVIKSSLEQFGGAHRRFEFLYNQNNITVADDFAHHPTELSNTLQTAMNMGFNNVWAVFQPHTFSRTFMLLNDFVKALSIADKVIISDILPVRETNKWGVKSTDLTSKIPQSFYIPTFEEISDFLLNNVKPGDLIITLGGGDVYKCANLIVKKLSDKYST